MTNYQSKYRLPGVDGERDLALLPDRLVAHSRYLWQQYLLRETWFPSRLTWTRALVAAVGARTVSYYAFERPVSRWNGVRRENCEAIST